MTFDWFATAGRRVPRWLIRASIVNSWIWPATILVSSEVGFRYGVGGPLWYAVGASLQFFLLAVLAQRLQRSGARVRTFAEFLRGRFDAPTHRTLALYSLTTSLSVCTLATVGGAVTLSALTGLDVRVAALLIPLTFTSYTALGGLRLTVFTDFFYLCCTLGGLAILVGLMWHRVPLASVYAVLHARPETGMLAFGSSSGLAFGLINFIAQLGTVLVDQTYWQRAIASRPGEAANSFVAAGLLWLPIPLIAGTMFGVIGAGLQLHPGRIDAIAPVVAVHVLGTPGAYLFLGVMFSVFLSSGDSSVLAASTLVACDLYRPGERGERMERRRLRMARVSAAAFGLAVGVLSTLLLAFHIEMGWLFMVVGIFGSSAAVPVLLGFLRPQYGGAGALIGMRLGSICGVVVWLAYAWQGPGGLSLQSSGELAPLLAGNLATIGASVVCCVLGPVLEPALARLRDKTVQ